jgi:hypothetical protein
MRRLLGRKSVTIIAAIISLTAIPAAGIVATATPALASVTICNVAGIMGCVGAPTLGNGDPAVLTASGREITRLDQHFTWNTFEVYRLQFAAAPSQCAGVAATGNITLRDCSGGNSNNTNWAREPVSGGFVWISITNDRWLTSQNQLGQQLFISGGCTNSCYTRWNN